ncbi:MAG: ATP-dependent Clp protease ATP-binding subunit [Terriglobia bacterium]|nr:MAG: ATP-dependent Clp protease ATP-binding subunit [Terriglobia bacterium]
MCAGAALRHILINDCKIVGRFRDLDAPQGERKMARLSLLDPTKTGREAADLKKKLRRLVVGQEEAIHEVVRTYQTHVTGLSPTGRPIGNFLFLGPTGTGKTRIVEALAQSLLDDPKAVIKIDCGEFQHSHEVAKLIGSPPGYLGHRETHALLSQEALNRHHTEKIKISLVLFDEIEKASDAVWNLLLGILDKGILTLGDNRKVDFSSAMVFLTSNLGAAEMCALGNPQLGFHSAAPEDAPSHQEVGDRMSRIGVAAARRKFTPEFINRLDKIVVFKPLGEEELRTVVDIELDIVRERILNATAGQPFGLSITDSAREFLLAEGTDSRYGARHLKRAIERLLIQPLSNLMASGQIRRGDYIRVTHSAGSPSLIFYEAAASQAWEFASRAA